MRGDPDKMKGVQKYVAMLLRQQDRPALKMPEGEILIDADMKAMAKEFVRTLRALENAIIADVTAGYLLEI
ncbi:TPA: hypothetical protein EYG96_00305 [Candidatus Gracilibacteria bacterium]|nr:hypothetical protein [Candidatus Gracilibacteria bacterium]HIQ57768.1 hypothetical protein [Candidatus Gracilibacteria bacterium]